MVPVNIDKLVNDYEKTEENIRILTTRGVILTHKLSNAIEYVDERGNSPVGVDEVANNEELIEDINKQLSRVNEGIEALNNIRYTLYRQLEAFKKQIESQRSAQSSMSIRRSRRITNPLARGTKRRNKKRNKKTKLSMISLP